MSKSSSYTMRAKVDETSCGPVCQHPECWASNRRIQKHVPRVLSPVSHREIRNNNPVMEEEEEEDDFGLPTLKVVNMLEDYGFSQKDRFPSSDQILLSKQTHRRSSSLPSIPHLESIVPPHPPPPTVSPTSSAPESHRSTQSAPVPLKPIPSIKKVEVHEVFDWEDLRKNWTDTFVASQYYVWCPSKKLEQRRPQRDDTSRRSGRDSRRVRPKNISGDLLPYDMQHNPRAKKPSSRKSRKTPSGGQPYTPRGSGGRQSSQQIQMVEIGPVENIEPDGLNELLSLPRDILIEVLQHTKQSDLLSKEKIHAILQKIIPQLQFHQDLETVSHPSGSPGLNSGRVLQNKKLTLLDSRVKHQPSLMEHYHPRALYYMDDHVLSRVSTANFEEQLDDGRELSSASPALTDTTPRRKTPAITVDTIPQTKITSISTKSLPPLEPGVRPTKPFAYKGNVMPDLTLGPVPSPPRREPSIDDRSETPYTEMEASSIHVTMPTVGSTDRSGLSPLGYYLGSPISVPPGMSTKLTATPPPSEDMDGNEEYPLHALSPSLSTHVPKPPLGTPNTLPKTSQSLNWKHDENWSPIQPRTPSNTPMASNIQLNPNSTPASPEKALGTITEAHSEYTDKSIRREPRTSTLPFTSPSPPPSLLVPAAKSEATSTSWSPALANSVIPQVSEKSKQSPMLSYHTPAPEVLSPEPWPLVDERDFYNKSPESSRKSIASDLAAQKFAEQQSVEDIAPAPPPPSPEPRDSSSKELDSSIDKYLNENVDVGKSPTTSKSSLAPLQEEGDEEDGEEVENKHSGEEEDVDVNDIAASKNNEHPPEVEINNDDAAEKRNSGERLPVPEIATTQHEQNEDDENLTESQVKDEEAEKVVKDDNEGNEPSGLDENES